MTQPIPPDQLQRVVDTAAIQAMQSDHIAGLAVAVVQDGKRLLTKGYGFSSPDGKIAVDPEGTLFRIGSASKTFTWILLMQEVADGRIRLEDPINKYLPESLQIPSQGFAKPIRVLDLMNHSAGFSDRGFGELFVNRGDRVESLDGYLKAHRPARVREPGLFPSYSNFGAALAGALIAHVEGTAFEDLAEQRIFNPLQMERTTFREPHGDQRRLAAPMSPVLARSVSTGFGWQDGAFQPRGFEFIGGIAPAGSASMSAGDAARYLLAILAGGGLGSSRIYGPDTAEALHSPLESTPSWQNGWSHGFMTFRLPGGLEGYGHGGSTISFKTNLVVVPSLRLGVFVSTNTETGAAFAARLPRLILNAFYSRPELSPAPSAVEDSTAARLAGDYLTTRRAYSGLEGFVDHLIGVVSVRQRRPGDIILDGGDAPGEYFLTSDRASYLAPDQSDGVRFEGATEASQLRFSTAYNLARYEKVGWWGSPTLFAGLSLVVAGATLGNLIGVVVRRNRSLPEEPWQRRSGKLSFAASLLWATTFAAFAGWCATGTSAPQIMYNFPGPILFTASACALAAGLSSLALATVLPLSLRSKDGWSSWRKVRHSLSVC